MWIIASIPLWIMGATTALIGVGGFWLCIKDGDMRRQPVGIFLGFMVLMLLAAGTLYLAARVAS